MVASLVGLPLEVDKINMKRWDFVRVKIGCRDMTRVPAMVEGLLDFHFYDFTFQREVPTEGVTNAAGNRWTRNSDRQEEDSPSPKKPKRGDTKRMDPSQVIPSGDSNKGKSSEVEVTEGGKEHQQMKQDPIGQKENSVQIQENFQPTEEVSEVQVSTENVKEKDGENENSDQGLSFDDIISPGGEHFTFGSFQNVEIKNLWKFDTGNNSSTVINEYGTNWVKSKPDPLVVVEAKQALLSGQHSPLEAVHEETHLVANTQEEQVGNSDEDSTGKVSIPSPYNSTQETADWSSQDFLSQELPDVGENLPPKLVQKQSERLRNQGNNNIKITEKAEVPLAKKNLEGNHLNFKISFVVLSNSDLMLRSSKMGVDTKDLPLEQFNIIKDLEQARMSLKNKSEKESD